jgi:hypothetical protein
MVFQDCVFENTGGLLDHQEAEGIAGGGAAQLNPGLYYF